MSRSTIAPISEGIITHADAIEGICIIISITVEHVGGYHISKALNEGCILGTAETLLVLLQCQELNIHRGAVLQDNAGILYLLGGTLASLDTTVNLADRWSRQASSDSGYITSWQIAFLPHCILGNRVDAFQCLNDKGNGTVRVDTLFVIAQSQCLSSQNAHLIHLLT